jgi:hypothetical protein
VESGLPIAAALQWLAFAAMIAGISQARLDPATFVLTAISTAGFILALAWAFMRRRWMVWASLLISWPIALWSFVWLLQVVSLLRWSFTPLGRQGHPESLLGYTSFLWFCLFVSILMLLLPVVWGRQLRRSVKVEKCARQIPNGKGLND